MNILLRILLVSVFVLVVDGIWLRLQRGMYRKTIRETQKREMKVRIAGAIWSYVSIIALIVMFAEFVEVGDFWPLYGFIYGALIYGVFNGTNVAIFREYSVKTAVTDTLWGGILFSVSIALYLRLQRGEGSLGRRDG
jgi:uncharacterized membrane protein